MIDDIIRQAEDATPTPGHAGSRLKSRIFSELMMLAQDEGPLRVLSQNRADGEKLCVFEHAVAMLPSNDLQSRNPCSVCHARVLGETVENAPIFWPGCPYSRYCGH